MQLFPNINARRIYGHLQLDPGTSTSGPLQLQSGALTTGGDMHPGMIEFLTDRVYVTRTSGTIRETVAYLSDVAAAGGGTVTSVSGTPNRISRSGPGSDPVLDIAATYVGQTSITTLGTITTGSWEATPITDDYISSAVSWNAKQEQLNGTGLVRVTGTSITYDNTAYLTANEAITISGEASGVGSTSIALTLDNASVTSKILTGLSVSGSVITAGDTILSALGKIQNQLNGVVGGVSYTGSWDADTNTPTLADGVGTKGHYYVISNPGSTEIDGIDEWKVGDWIIFNGTAWQKVDNTDNVISVNGYSGIVVLSTADIAENTNMYFTYNRVLNTVLAGFISGPGTITSGDTVLTAIQKLNGNINALPVISGTTNRITVTSGVVDISPNYIGQSSITTLGTITSGVWNGTTISTSYTEAKIKGSATTNGVLFATSADTAGTDADFTFDGSRLNINGGISQGIAEITTNYTLTASDYTAILTGFISATLPPCSMGIKGTIYKIKNANTTFGVTVDLVPNGTDFLEGVNAAYTLNSLETITVQCTGTAWWIV